MVPDTQLKPNVPMEHMAWAGRYAAEKRPDVIVYIGDGADMESLSSYDRGKRSFEGRRYKKDIEAFKEGLELFENGLSKANGYKPRKVFTVGNHEDRIDRAIEDNPELDGLISISDLGLEGHGWEVHDFLKVVKIEGVEFAHYFVSGSMGRAVSSASVMLRERQCSCIQGHNQRFDMAVHPRTGAIAMMVGAFYQHQEKYLTAQGQATRLQLVMLNEVKNGRFDPMLISMGYLKRKYS